MTPRKVSVDLIALAERVEAATGPDLDLERDIATALGAGAAYIAGSRDWHFTKSLDAAITLVPEGWRWIMRQACPDKANPDERGFFARLETEDFETVTWGKGDCWITDHIAGQEAKCWAATPALALTAAALRSRAQDIGEAG